MPIALVLGACLHLVPTVRIAVPTLPSAVLVGLLVPGTVTLLLGWTVVDRWPTGELALARQGRRITAARIGATIAVCLVAAAVASAGHDRNAIAGTCWLLAVALLVDLLVAGSWWIGVIVGQVVMLQADYRQLPWAEVLTSPWWAVPALAAALAATVLRE
ncbi:hypothetical protein [Nocardioides humi]|uniref:Uncharacterized protein n=1 Tax=Nocardioides humi TaxID=449461 RepID=A0ABN2B0A3_9ACTN|nr:hypothetical protein [Nocardioides humi]